MEGLENINPKRADGALVRSVALRTENPCVAGSIPAGTTLKPQINLGVFYLIKILLPVFDDFFAASSIFTTIRLFSSDDKSFCGFISFLITAAK